MKIKQYYFLNIVIQTKIEIKTDPKTRYPPKRRCVKFSTN